MWRFIFCWKWRNFFNLFLFRAISSISSEHNLESQISFLNEYISSALESMKKVGELKSQPIRPFMKSFQKLSSFSEKCSISKNFSTADSLTRLSKINSKFFDFWFFHKLKKRLTLHNLRLAALLHKFSLLFFASFSKQFWDVPWALPRSISCL